MITCPQNIDLDSVKKIEVPMERIMSTIPSYATVATRDMLKKVL